LFQFRGNGEQAPIEAMENAASFFIAELTAVHLQEVAGGETA
jgi:hypothetical protein